MALRERHCVGTWAVADLAALRREALPGVSVAPGMLFIAIKVTVHKPKISS